MNSGIYKIANKVTGDFYIGSAVDINKRWNQHKFLLKKQKHYNYKLQNLYYNNGLDILLFEIVEHIDKKDLIVREQYYLDILEPTYNIRKIAKSNLGLKLSKETKRKMSEAKRSMKCQ